MNPSEYLDSISPATKDTETQQSLNKSPNQKKWIVISVMAVSIILIIGWLVVVGINKGKAGEKEQASLETVQRDLDSRITSIVCGKNLDSSDYTNYLVAPQSGERRYLVLFSGDDLGAILEYTTLNYDTAKSASESRDAAENDFINYYKEGLKLSEDPFEGVFQQQANTLNTFFTIDEGEINLDSTHRFILPTIDNNQTVSPEEVQSLYENAGYSCTTSTVYTDNPFD